MTKHFASGTRVVTTHGFDRVYVGKTGQTLPLPKDSTGYVQSVAAGFGNSVYWIKFDCLPAAIECHRDFVEVQNVSPVEEKALLDTIKQLQEA
jgi:hypothetical protein